MDFTAINSLLDAAVAYILSSSQQLAAKDKIIADLQAQVSTANATINADESELKQLTDKLNQLSGVLTPVASSKS